MSISLALNNAISGLGAAGRSAQVVSSNIANALTDGYGRREVALGASRTGGVQIAGITRASDPALLMDRRFAEAETGGDGARAAALGRIARLLGDADSAASLSGRVAGLRAQLTEASSRPDSTLRLEAAAEAARDLAMTLNRASDGVQAERLAADAAIARQVETLNTGLAGVQNLNRNIARLTATGDSTAGLVDRRQQVIDELAVIVPLRELPRPNGSVALLSAGGQVLLDIRPAEIGFTRSSAITPGMSADPGPLSGLTISGKPVNMDDPQGRMSGGTLAAGFDIRDRLAPEAQARLDAFARDLVERFEAPAADPTRAATDPGLFTDAGARLDPAATTGLAGRIALNALADPAAGGAAWRLRDGLGAAAPGLSGDAAGLNRLTDALTARRSPAAPELGATPRDTGGLAGDLVARAAGASFRADESQAFSRARADTLREQELANGVDTDAEIQKLLLIERSYAANAKVIQAADAMLQRLLEI